MSEVNQWGGVSVSLLEWIVSSEEVAVAIGIPLLIGGHSLTYHLGGNGYMWRESCDGHVT